MKHIAIGKFGVFHIAGLAFITMRMESVVMAIMLVWIAAMVADVVQMDYEIKYGIRKCVFD